MPVADELAHLPPLALIIDHVCGNFDVSEDDDSGRRATARGETHNAVRTTAHKTL
jgi:hypothetical protein